MKKLFYISLISFLTASANAQSISAGKDTHVISPSTVEVTAVAIPFDQANQVVIDSATYHQAVTTGIEPKQDEQFVSVNAAVLPASNADQGRIKKEAIQLHGNEVRQQQKEVQKIIKAEPPVRSK